MPRDENAAPEWSAEMASHDLWRGMDMNQPSGDLRRYFRGHLQAAYDAGAAIAPHVAAEREAAWIAGRDKAVAFIDASGPSFSLMDVRKLTPPAGSSLDALVAARVAEAVAAERERIIAGVRAEAGTTPCDEDQRVVEDVADLIEADFDYEAAEKLHVTREAAAKEPGHD